MNCSKSVILAIFLFTPLMPGFGQTHKELVLGEGVNAHEGIDAVYGRFSKAYQDLDVALVANLYGEGAYYMSPGADIQHGRETIRSSFEGFFQSVEKSGGKIEISFEILKREVSSNLAYDVGIYTLTSHPKDGKTRASRGKFVVVAKKENDGMWRFQVDSYSDLKQ